MKLLRKAFAALAGILAAGALLAQPATAKAPLSAFADPEAVQSATLSPDGSRMAYLSRIGGDDFLVLHDFKTASEDVQIVKVTGMRTRGISFVDANHVLIYTSAVSNSANFIGRDEKLMVSSVNLATRKVATLLGKADNVYAGQRNLANIAAIDPDGQNVYMAVFTGLNGNVGNSDYSYDVLKVNLDTGASVRGQTLHGDRNTVDWLVDPHGKPLVRETFDKVSKVHEVLLYSAGSQHSQPIDHNIVGISSKDGSFISSDSGDQEFSKMFTLSVNGKPAEPVFQRENKEIDAYIKDYNSVIYGVRYAGMFPTYEMFDPALNADIDAIVKALPGSSVYLASQTADWSQILFLVTGGARSERYMLFNRATKKLANVAPTRPDIKPQDVGEVTTVEYKARDGLTIPAIVTWPVGLAADQRKNLPLVVMPHGGPEDYDSVRFDFLAQFIANEGYMVLQPNFRGSAGLGASFREAGHKQWGRKMQDDITDGAKAVATMGWADPKRTCIVGWSYGGYAALAGGALTPELYKCVVSIAGPSNLRQMLDHEKNMFGEDGPFRFWRELIGDPVTDKDAIDAISPLRHAADFQAPVLLVHGAEDTTVETTQSDQMEAALRGAKKSVSYLRIRGDEHSLVGKGSREQMLTALGNFLSLYLR